MTALSQKQLLALSLVSLYNINTQSRLHVPHLEEVLNALYSLTPLDLVKETILSHEDTLYQCTEKGLDQIKEIWLPSKHQHSQAEISTFRKLFRKLAEHSFKDTCISGDPFISEATDPHNIANTTTLILLALSTTLNQRWKELPLSFLKDCEERTNWVSSKEHNPISSNQSFSISPAGQSYFNSLIAAAGESSTAKQAQIEAEPSPLFHEDEIKHFIRIQEILWSGLPSKALYNYIQEFKTDLVSNLAALCLTHRLKNTSNRIVEHLKLLPAFELCEIQAKWVIVGIEGNTTYWLPTPAGRKHFALLQEASSSYEEEAANPRKIQIDINLAKRQAGRLLGFRDEELEAIQYDDRPREALLLTVINLNKRLEEKQAEWNGRSASYEKNIKALKVAKGKANKRADLAEARLRNLNDSALRIVNALSYLDTSGQKISATIKVQ